MNAICGVLSDGEAGDSLALVSAALDAGAGAGRIWQAAGVALGVRHGAGATGALAGATGATGSQSLCVHDDAGLAVVADARLDDRPALCDALGIPRAERAGLADGDLILRAWLRWGGDCPGHLLGDYAFALWDARRRVLFCARDHIGARPFYHALAPEGFVFASTVEAVLAAPSVSGELDEATVAAWLTRPGLATTTRTFFKAVRKLPPGHALAVDRGSPRPGARLQRHWRPERTSRAAPASDDEYAEELLHLCALAVKARLPADGPVGTHLSGGLDSSGVTVLAARELRRQGRAPPLAFSYLPAPGETPPGAVGAPEYGLVHAVSGQERLQVFHRSPSADDLVAVLSRDGAFPGVHVHLNEDVVQRCAAEQGVRVLLSGWGGDEGVSFNGRGLAAHLLLSGRWRELAAHRGRDAGTFAFLAGVVLGLAHPNLPMHLRRLARGEEPLHRRWLIDPAFAQRTKPLPDPAPRFVGVRRTQLRLMQSGHLAERMEGWAAGGARHGIEYRYPLLDRRLLEFALGLPPEQFRRGRHTRRMMRNALARVLPPEVCRHSSKADPVRFASMKDAFAGALPVVRRMLEARAEPLSRARYVDMPRLLERLHPDRSRAGLQVAPLRVALQFLDF